VAVNEMKIQNIDIKSIMPYKGNAKKHDKRQISNVAESIKQFGFVQPIVVDANNEIVIGHCRYEAAKKLKMQEVPCVSVDTLTPEQVQKLRLLDNKLNESEWNFDLLAEQIPELDFSGFDVDWELPIDEEEKEIIEDEAPEVDEESEPITKLGDIWQLGRHRLMCGDSTDKETVAKLMGGKNADMVFTDPPWNVNYGAVEKGNAQGYKPRTIKNDFMGTEDFKNFMFSAFACMNEASKPGAMTYVVMSAQEWGNMMLTLAQNDYHWSSTIIWNKDRLVLSRKDYHTKYEPIWYGWKEGESRLCPLEDRKQSDVWDFDRPTRSDEHPTMKPVALVARAIENSSHKGDIVLDLFGGSGTTLIACEQLDRSCYCMELDAHYCDVIIKRWENLTGEKAKLLDK
jgi:DNA modification methylase